jgi:hypothetical protein
MGSDEHYEVQAILDSCLHAGHLEFLVSWKCYGYEENSWVSDQDVSATRLILQFYHNHPGAPHHIHVLNFGQMGLQSSPWRIRSLHP